MEPNSSKFPPGYEPLRLLSSTSPVYLCRESATDRLLVIKLAEQSKKLVWEKEGRTLAELASFPASPALYFSLPSLEASGPCYLGMEYRAGTSLLELQGKMKSTDKTKVFNALHKTLEVLHYQYGRNHGDLSPKNILAFPSPLDPGEWGISLVDWEFSDKIRDQNLETYSHYRGTEGFTDIEPTDPFTKDWKAVEACQRFLGYTEVETGQNTRSRLKQWLKRT